MKWVTHFLVLTIIFCHSINFAQKKEPSPTNYGWKKRLVSNLNFTQNSFDNWSQGGENSWAWQLNINSEFENNQPKHRWTNTGKFSFGKTRVGQRAARKSIDEIKLESVHSFKIGFYVNPYIAATGQSQLTRGYKYTNDTRTEVSDFLDPAYFTQSFGFGYSPIVELKTRLGFTLKETIANRHAARYTDEPGTEHLEKLRLEPGMESVTDFERKLNAIVFMTSRLEFFSNLQRMDEIDITWDTVFDAQISKIVSINFNFRLFYDKDISPQRQIKQTLAVGLTYSFL